MNTKLTSSLFSGLLFFVCAHVLKAQQKSVKLFLDCQCERRYVQQEIDFINHVRDQDLANVQLNIYDIANGSGGRTYKLDFQGKGIFEGILVKRDYDTNVNMTSDEVRKGLVVAIKSGLLRYLVDSDMGENIDYKISKEGQAKRQDIDFEDPWNNWIFEVYGAAEFDKEASRRNFEYELGFESDRVTEKWRIRGDFELSQATSNFVRNDEEFTSSRERYYGFGSVVRSLSDHWSAGLFVGADYNTFNNLDLALNITPAIEYNIFPYREVLRREIVFAYRIGYLYNDYIDMTIFGKEQESLFNHSLDIQVRYRQPWGNLFGRLRASSFLNDFSKNRAQLFGRLSIRIFKGLAVRFSGNVEYIQDQINLPAGDASLEDLLLQQRQIATDFELGFSVGLSYTFGSAFNNIINNRL